jgi:hypothetical protein
VGPVCTPIPTPKWAPIPSRLPDLNRVLKKCFDSIFSEELAGWYNDPSVWPDRRTVKMFREWFEVEFASMITDLSDDPLLHDED